MPHHIIIFCENVQIRSVRSPETIIFWTQPKPEVAVGVIVMKLNVVHICMYNCYIFVILFPHAACIRKKNESQQQTSNISKSKKINRACKKEKKNSMAKKSTKESHILPTGTILRISELPHANTSHTVEENCNEPVTDEAASQMSPVLSSVSALHQTPPRQTSAPKIITTLQTSSDKECPESQLYSRNKVIDTDISTPSSTLNHSSSLTHISQSGKYVLPTYSLLAQPHYCNIVLSPWGGVKAI